MTSPQIECRNLWKIYGGKADAALEAVRKNNLSKEEVRDRFGCVLGVRDVSLSPVKKCPTRWNACDRAAHQVFQFARFWA